jgi:anti-sigma-K factor RskA
MTAPHDDLTASLGPAALGLLPEVERQQLDRHLRDCPSCQAELAALTAVVGRLGELGRDQALLADLRPDPARAAAALTAVAADRRRLRRRTQRWQAALATAAALVVLAAGLTTASALSRDDLPLEAVAVRADAGVQASADLVPHTWGVEIKLTATGLPEGRPFTVQVRTSSGEVVEAGAFLGTGDRTLLCNLNAAVLRRDAVAFVVLDREGDQVLAADL